MQPETTPEEGAVSSAASPVRDDDTVGHAPPDAPDDVPGAAPDDASDDASASDGDTDPVLTKGRGTRAERRLKRLEKRRGRPHIAVRGLGLGSFVFTVLILSLAGIAAYLSTGREIAAPVWLHERIEAKIAEDMPQQQVTFGRLKVVMHDGWRPRLRLTDLAVSDGDGRQIVGFSQVDARLAVEPLLRGKVLPRDVSLVGMFATLRRDATGAVRLSGGADLAGPAQDAPSLAVLINRLDDVLLHPDLDLLETVDLQALTLRYEDATTGRAWTVDGGRVRLARAGDELTLSADLALLSGTADIATVEANYSSRIGDVEADFGVSFTDVDARDIAAQGPAFAWLDAVRAPISGSMRTGVADDGSLRPLNATLSIEAGALQPTEATRAIPFQSAQAYFTFDPDAQTLRFDELSVVSRWATGRAEGTASLQGMEAGRLENLVAQFQFSALTLNPQDLLPEPVSITRADADLRLTLDPFRIELGQAALRLGERDVVLTSDLRAEADGWRFALDARSDAMDWEEVLPLWPETLAAGTRRWLAANVEHADLSAVDIALRGAPDVALQTYISFDYDAVDLRYLKTFPHLTGGRGHGELIADQLVLSVDAGQVTAPDGGRIDLAGSAFSIPNVRIKGGAPAIVDLRTDSSITSALSLLDLPPLNVMQRIDRPTDIAEGRALLEGQLRFAMRPGLQPDDILYSVSGQLEDVVSDVVITDRRLASNTLILEASPGELIIGGPGTLDGIPFEATWQQPLGQGAPGQVSGTVTVNPEALQAFRVGLPPGTLRGATQAQIAITLPADEDPRLELTSTLQGAALSIPALDWGKGTGAAARLRVDALIGDNPRINRLELSAPGLTAVGSVRLNDAGGLAEARFARVQVGDWLNAPVTLIGRGANAAPAVRVDGGEIDLRRANFGSGGGAEGGPMTLSLDRLQITEAIALTQFAGQFDAGRGLNGRFSGRVNGGPSVEGRVLPQNGRAAVQINSADAGGVVAAAGLLQQARGGNLQLTLLPVGEEGTFDGTLTIDGTRVKKAPVMADLLSALSIVGLLEQLSGQGIAFNDVQADFRLTPSAVYLQRASATGPSLGISMEGQYDLGSKRMDMQGVISPVYFLNALGSIFSRGREGLIGFNYRVRGQVDDPRVQVNPLSALTPGIFREIFRAPPPDIPGAGGNRARAVAPEGFAPTVPEPRERVRGVLGEDR